MLPAAAALAGWYLARLLVSTRVAVVVVVVAAVVATGKLTRLAPVANVIRLAPFIIILMRFLICNVKCLLARYCCE